MRQAATRSGSRWLEAGAVAALALAMAGAALATRGMPWSGRAPGGAGSPLPGSAPDSTAPSDTSVVRRAGFAMGSFVQVTAAGPGARAAVDAAMAEVERLDALFDRFDPDGPLARVAKGAGRHAVEVPEEVGRLTRLALTVAQQTEGAFDPTVAPVVDLWGFGASYDRDPPRHPPKAQELAQAVGLVDFRQVCVRHEGTSWSIYLEQPGMALDLGAVAQGYAADRAIEVLEKAGLSSALVDVGGEVRALGRRPGDGKPWRLGIQHPRQSGKLLDTVTLQDGAAATSGDYERYFEFEGVRYTHLIDARTGQPSRRAISVTVFHPTSAAVADALSTALAIVGPEQGERLLRQWPGTSAILVDPSMRVRRIGQVPR
ncbi:FAD:protein FMN transferase [Carboxydochorda subterranea]|uniref:FAD:protein FMN transferase n=1 Tax=Carboxydichorda subterranea TaxID=3109565 RepID=A0ABZ1BZF9_9FIRM|nr:FAD:protein FMN transferase [Limnochorda sp. L945t]WRP18124.1 FAD:protein FMN transferase [Limnochorda sp. L945t]